MMGKWKLRVFTSIDNYFARPSRHYAELMLPQLFLLSHMIVIYDSETLSMPSFRFDALTRVCRAKQTRRIILCTVPFYPAATMHR